MPPAVASGPPPLFWRPDETAFDLFSRLSRPPLRLADPSSGPHHRLQLQSGEALEVCGEPGSGKTAVLFETLMRCILPLRHDGLGGHAVLIDTDGVDLTRLALDLRRHYRSRHRLSKPAGGPDDGAQRAGRPSAAGASSDGWVDASSDETVELAFVHRCLSHIHVLRAGDRHELILALHAVLGYISGPASSSSGSAATTPPDAVGADAEAGASGPADGGGAGRAAERLPPMPGAASATLSPPGEIQLLAIDSISRFHWFGRAQKRIPSLSDADAAVPRLLSQILLRRSLCVVWARSPLGRPELDCFPIHSATDALTSLCARTLCLRRRHAGAGETDADAVEGLLVVPGGARAGGEGQQAPARFDLVRSADGRLHIRPDPAR